jgi:hypothetical protein
VSRLIPEWIGNVVVPDNRTTTIQLLMCWAQLLGEVTNVKPLLRKMEQPMTEKSFVFRAQEVTMHLSGVMADKKLEKKNQTNIFTGNGGSPIWWINARMASVLHVYFDEPDLKLNHPCKECPGEV